MVWAVWVGGCRSAQQVPGVSTVEAAAGGARRQPGSQAPQVQLQLPGPPPPRRRGQLWRRAHRRAVGHLQGAALPAGGWGCGCGCAGRWVGGYAVCRSLRLRLRLRPARHTAPPPPPHPQGHYERPPYSASSMRSAYHVRELEVHRLARLARPLDIFLSHDWPQGIARHGDMNHLFQRKGFLRREVRRRAAAGRRPCQTAWRAGCALSAAPANPLSPACHPLPAHPHRWRTTPWAAPPLRSCWARCGRPTGSLLTCTPSLPRWWCTTSSAQHRSRRPRRRLPPSATCSSWRWRGRSPRPPGSSRSTSACPAAASCRRVAQLPRLPCAPPARLKGPAWAVPLLPPLLLNAPALHTPTHPVPNIAGHRFPGRRRPPGIQLRPRVAGRAARHARPDEPAAPCAAAAARLPAAHGC